MRFPAWATDAGSVPPDILAMRFAVLAALVVGFYMNVHSVPLFDVDEGAFSEATREMFTRGDFISTYLNGVPRYDKPILIYWLQAASVSVFGINELAFRLPSIVAATLWVATIYLFIKRYRDEHSALTAAIIMATVPAICLIGRAATADALLNLLLTVSMCLIFLYYMDPRKRLLKWIYLSMALGFLTKGPIAILIPFVVSGIFFGIKSKLGLWCKAILYVPGILLFLAVAGPWYVAQYLKEGQPFIEGFFLHHNIDRFQGPMEGHAGSLLYYIPVVLIGVLPYTSVLLRCIVRLKSLLKSDVNLFAALWFAFVFLFFSFSGTKLPHYIIYGFPALIILMTSESWLVHRRFWWYLPAIAGFIALLALPDLFDAYSSQIHDAYARTALSNAGRYFPQLYSIWLVLSLAIAIVGVFAKRVSVHHGLPICGILMAASLSGLAAIAGQILQQPIKDAALYAKSHDLEVVMWRLTAPSFDVYSERLVQKREPRKGDVVVTKSIYLSQLNQPHILFQENAIVLVKLQ